MACPCVEDAVEGETQACYSSGEKSADSASEGGALADACEAYRGYGEQKTEVSSNGNRIRCWLRRSLLVVHFELRKVGVM